MILDGAAPPLGLGAMRLSEAKVAPETAERILHGALDGGLRFIDTANVYAPSAREVGHNERLVAAALASWRGDRASVTIGTKGGLRREAKLWVPDGRAKHLEAACEASRAALDVEVIDLYQLHALDPRTKPETSFRALERLLRTGKVKRIGLCNVNLEELELALEHVPVSSVQVALSPLDPTPLKNGLVAFCARRGITVIAHSPLGGHRRRRSLPKDRAIGRAGDAVGGTPQEVALAWLRTLPGEVVPIPGATRLESLESSLRSLDLDLPAEVRGTLDAAWGALRVREPAPAPPPPRPRGEGEVVLFVGYPGAGKSSFAERFTARGYERLNRDDRGGTLAGLLPELERRLASGARHLVLDNTYPKRASRFDVVEAARRFDVPVRCLWLATSLEQSQLNAATRMVRRYGRLLAPQEMKRLSKKDPNAFPPDAQFRYRRELEPPREEEGFSAIERVAFVADPPERERAERAVLFDPKEDGLREKLAAFEKDGYRLLGVSYEPRRRESSYELHGIEVAVCNHPPPASCWCRKPLPGLGVLFVEKYGIDPARSIVVGDAPSDRGFAERLGMRFLSSREL